ncbi:phosphoadenosine phosphosulfate reductase domain-containing protein [Burkholderia cenocepacia]|uniref:phosphoadenosine phosphosulfate reductase domain-containing protein n=1 Tax=Burkholderia cenocepacia TaxID=95486 RepID=UPI000B2FFA06|nr:phosphoadenosine phosphosulfate reductase family protein [Burkholderia cenocepacia]
MLHANAVAAVGVSGGKDSDACAIAVDRHLDAIDHTGPRVLVHADLGRVEWKDSLPSCQRLAERLGWELLVVERQAGDMLTRWEGRWANNVARYVALECVKLILPWSTPSMRFCTSELKTAVIASALRRRFPGQDIVNVTGVRRQESAARSKMPVWSEDARLSRKNSRGVTWNAIIDWPVEDVLYTIESAGLRLHEAYTVYGASRVSCAYCIMSAEADLRAAARCTDNHAVYIAMVELEAASSFAFQGNRWLADVAPELLSRDLRERVARAKEVAVLRQAAEARIPKPALYAKGWPSEVPSLETASVIAGVRREVSDLLGLNARYLTVVDVRDRYQELMNIRPERRNDTESAAQCELFQCAT